MGKGWKREECNSQVSSGKEAPKGCRWELLMMVLAIRERKEPLSLDKAPRASAGGRKGAHREEVLGGELKHSLNTWYTLFVYCVRHCVSTAVEQ